MSLWRFKVALALLVGFWAVASLVIGLPRSFHNTEADELSQVFATSEGCPRPCWEGIRPGITSSTDAIARLQTLPWVINITAIQGIVTNDSIIRWEWNGKQASIIDAERGGTIWLHNGLVYSIELPLRATYATVWQAIDKPQYISMSRAPREKPSAEYHALYADGFIDLYGETTCPLKAWTLFTMPVDVRFGSEKPRSIQLQRQRTICR